MASLKVIGTGFGRRGTDSMQGALEIPGFGPCHHMRELIEDQKHERLWRSVVARVSPDQGSFTWRFCILCRLAFSAFQNDFLTSRLFN